MLCRKVSFSVIALLAAALVSCNLPGPTQTPMPPTPAVLQSTATFTPTQEPVVSTATATEGMSVGTVNGKLSYPSEFIPPQRVIFYQAGDFTHFYSVDTQLNQNSYSIQVPEGTYYVVAYVIDSGMASGYSAAVPCGLKADCNDHSLIPVTVAAGTTLNDIDPADWYAPQGFFPAKP